MERDFLSLNFNDSGVVVKEEAVEGVKDSAFSKGLGAQWPFSDKVSTFPHFMSFKAAQQEKTAKSIVSSGFMATSSTTDAFDTILKLPLGETEKAHDGQGGSVTYPMQVNAHLSPNTKMLPTANQPNSVSMNNALFKTHFASACQNFAGATPKQQLLGGIPVSAPPSALPSLGSAAAVTTEPWSNSKSSGAPAQLTIFYGGAVHVYDGVCPEKAQAIMFLACNGSTAASNIAQPRTQVQVPLSKQAGGDAGFANQPRNAPHSSAISSPISISSYPVAQSHGGSGTNDEVVIIESSEISSAAEINKVDPPNIITSRGPVATTTMIPSAVPQARKASLARFLEKRKERAMNTAPYGLSNKSSECGP